MERIGNKVSYIRKPFAKYGFVSAGLLAAAFLLAAAALTMSFHMQGNAPLNVGAMGFCSMIATASSIVYGVFAFFEKEKNYLLAKISLAADGVLTIVWLIVLVLG